MNAKVIVVIALCAAPLTGGPALAQVPPELAERGCHFFDNEDGSGRAVDFDVKVLAEGSSVPAYARYAPIMDPRWDNQISAVECDYHCSAVLYDETYRQGVEISTPSYQSGFYSLGGRDSNNRASSLAVFCTH